jgi:soluble lytic murein transglycosylase-like protein
MGKRSHNPAHFAILACMFCSALPFADGVQAQIAKVSNDDGRMLFVNAEPPPTLKLPSRRAANLSAAARRIDLNAAATRVDLSATAKRVDLGAATERPSIYLPPETSLSGKLRPSLNLDRDGAEKLVREAAERHSVDPALIRAVIQTESNWNPSAISRRGAVGLMQLIPTTAQRFGVNDLYSPQQNVDAGVKYLKTLLERYNGNLDLALAAYNAGEGAVDRAHGVPSFRETRNYVQRVQSAYFRPGSGRMDGVFFNPRAIRKATDPNGRIIFTND